MDKNPSNTKENNIIQNEIELMRFIISQCNEETLVTGGQVDKTGTMTFHYQLPSGLHVYNDRKFNFENIYKKSIDINELGSHIYITGTPIKELEDNKKSGRYKFSAISIMRSQDNPYISFSEKPSISFEYKVDNRYFDENYGIERARSSLLISTDLHPDSEYPISGGLLINGRKEYYIRPEELKGYVQGSEYFSDIFKRVIEENSEYNQLEMSIISRRIHPLFEMLSFEKQRLQQIDNYRTQNQHENNLDYSRMNEIRTAIEGIKDLKLTQEEINYLRNVLEELRESNNKTGDNNINTTTLEEK